MNPRIEIPGNPNQTRNVFIRSVENEFLRNVPDLAFDAVIVVFGEAERIIAVGTVVQRRIDFHILHVQDFREAAVNPVTVAGIAGDGIMDDAVANVQHPGIVDVDIGFEAALRQCSACVFRVVHIDSPAAELAVFKRDAHFIVAAVVEIQHVVVRVDAVPEEIDPVHQEHHQIRKLETTVRDNAFHIGIFRLVRAPGGFCFLRDKVIHQIGGIRHPEKQQICDVGVLAVRDDHGGFLRGPANQIAGLVREIGGACGKRLQRSGGSGSVSGCFNGRINVHHIEIDIRVNHSAYTPIKVE